MRDSRASLRRRNAVVLAITISIVVAFGAIVTDLLTPVIVAVVGKSNFAALQFTISGRAFYFGHFISAFIALLSLSSAVYFFAVRPEVAMAARRSSVKAPPSGATRVCRECLSEIPAGATRCAYCAPEQRLAA